MLCRGWMNRMARRGLSKSFCQTEMNNSDAKASAQHVLPCLVSLPCPILSIYHTHPLWAWCGVWVGVDQKSKKDVIFYFFSQRRVLMILGPWWTWTTDRGGREGDLSIEFPLPVLTYSSRSARSIEIPPSPPAPWREKHSWMLNICH